MRPFGFIVLLALAAPRGATSQRPTHRLTDADIDRLEVLVPASLAAAAAEAARAESSNARWYRAQLPGQDLVRSIRAGLVDQLELVKSKAGPVLVPDDVTYSAACSRALPLGHAIFLRKQGLSGAQEQREAVDGWRQWYRKQGYRGPKQEVAPPAEPVKVTVQLNIAYPTGMPAGCQIAPSIVVALVAQRLNTDSLNHAWDVELANVRRPFKDLLTRYGLDEDSWRDLDNALRTACVAIQGSDAEFDAVQRAMGDAGTVEAANRVSVRAHRARTQPLCHQLIGV